MSPSGKGNRIVAYLGGQGSFSEEACQRFLPDCDLMPLADFEAVAIAVCQGSADVAVLPIHNSLAGPIDAVLVLLAHPELRTIGKEQLDIRLHLLARTGTDLAEVRQVASHRAALRQCAAFIATHDLCTVETPSTAEAARQVAQGSDPARAAVASEAAADLYGLSILAHDIHDKTGSITTFSIVERRDQFA
jgi:prephenate dehydratase